jgi:hypothetical protein
VLRESSIFVILGPAPAGAAQESCREDEARGALIASWRSLTPAAKENIIDVARGVS